MVTAGTVDHGHGLRAGAGGPGRSAKENARCAALRSAHGHVVLRGHHADDRAVMTAPPLYSSARSPLRPTPKTTCPSDTSTCCSNEQACAGGGHKAWDTLKYWGFFHGSDSPPSGAPTYSDVKSMIDNGTPVATRVEWTAAGETTGSSSTSYWTKSDGSNWVEVSIRCPAGDGRQRAEVYLRPIPERRRLGRPAHLLFQDPHHHALPSQPPLGIRLHPGISDDLQLDQIWAVPGSSGAAAACMPPISPPAWRAQGQSATRRLLFAVSFRPVAWRQELHRLRQLGRQPQRIPPERITVNSGFPCTTVS